MRSRHSSPGRKSQAASILETLAEKIPDHILQEYFKELPPKKVRNILQEAAASIGPGTDEPVVPARKHPPEKPGSEKDWKGRLKGMILQLYTDGASRGNPGEAGAGVAILDELGEELVATGEYLGQCTNNEAEYRALLLGLARCEDFGHGRLKIHLDSELIVKQIRGEYRVKHPNLLPLFRETMQRLSGFGAFSITHVRREKNRRADGLANEAIDNHIRS